MYGYYDRRFQLRERNNASQKEVECVCQQYSNISITQFEDIWSLVQGDSPHLFIPATELSRSVRKKLLKMILRSDKVDKNLKGYRQFIGIRQRICQKIQQLVDATVTIREVVGRSSLQPGTIGSWLNQFFQCLLSVGLVESTQFWLFSTGLYQRFQSFWQVIESQEQRYVPGSKKRTFGVWQFRSLIGHGYPCFGHRGSLCLCDNANAFMRERIMLVSLCLHLA